MVVRRKVVKKSVKAANHVIFILDESGSMSSIRHKVVEVFNNWVTKIRDENKKHNQDTKVTLIKFANMASTVFFNADISTLKELSLSSYYPDGMTALFNGLTLGIDSVQALKEKDTSNLVVVITDGMENNSTHQNKTRSPQLIRDLQNQGNWSFVFLLPPGLSRNFISNYNLLSDNVREWTNDEKGLREAEQLTSGGISHFYGQRAMGQTAVSNFFKPIDLSNVKTRDLDNKLDEVTNDCLIIQVDKEEQIRDFVERKTRKSYIAGSAYYALTKREKVQNNKSLLILDKKTGTIYGGRKARNLVGIPEGQAGIVEPFNLTDKEVYIESRSVNRKLVRGSKVILYPK